MKQCQSCGIPDSTQHSLRVGGLCDGLKSGRFSSEGSHMSPEQARAEVQRITRGQRNPRKVGE